MILILIFKVFMLFVKCINIYLSNYDLI